MQLDEAPLLTFADIEAASLRIGGHIRRTPLLEDERIDRRYGATIFTKAEGLQRTGSFKLRGALNRVLQLSEEERARGIVAYSSDNHASAVAAAARVVGSTATIVVPSNAARAKLENSRWWGAEIVEHDPVTEPREAIAERLVQERGLVLVPPFDHLDVMAGAGTVGLEVGQELSSRGVIPDAVIVGISGGGLASGVLTALEHRYPGIDKYVVEPRGYEKNARSLEAGKPVPNPAERRTIVDGLAGPRPGDHTLRQLRTLGVRPVSVTDEEVLSAIALNHRFLKIVTEPAGAAPLAAVESRAVDVAGRRVILISSGSNVDPGVYASALEHGIARESPRGSGGTAEWRSSPPVGRCRICRH